MDKRKARQLASELLAAAARRLHDETGSLGLKPADRERVENAFDALATEMEGRAGLVAAATTPLPGQFALFERPGGVEDHE